MPYSSGLEKILYSRLCKYMPTKEKRDKEKIKKEVEAIVQRQVKIGKYTVDFLVQPKDKSKKEMIVEAEGLSHESKDERERFDYLESEGYEICRFTSQAILTNAKGTAKTIIKLAGYTPKH